MKIYRDGYRWIVGPDEQGCYSMTEGYSDHDSLKRAKIAAKELNKKTKEELDGMLMVFWTDERFEQACDAGKFGTEW